MKCVLCGDNMIWHDLVIGGESLVPTPSSGGDWAQIRYCMNDKCLLGSDKRHGHQTLYSMSEPEVREAE